MFAANLDYRAVDQHQLSTEEIVGGDAIFEAMSATGIHRDIAGDCAGKLRGRVRGVKKSVRPDSVTDGKIGDSGFHPREPVLGIDLNDAAHPGEAHNHRVLLRDSPAGERGPGTSRHHRHIVLMTESQDC